MACNCNQRPALTAVTVADQTVAAEGFLDFNTNSVRNGCSVVHVAGSNSITLASDGLYLVTFNGNVTPTAAGDITLQLISNGTVVPGAEATITGAAADIYNISFSTLVKELPSCCAIDNTTVLQVQSSAAATVNNASITIIKVA